MNTTERLVAIICDNSELDSEDIKPDSHLFEDLELDSLDFVDITFAIDQEFAVTVPIEDWMQAIENGAEAAEFFTFGKLLSFIEKQVDTAA